MSSTVSEFLYLTVRGSCKLVYWNRKYLVHHIKMSYSDLLRYIVFLIVVTGREEYWEVMWVGKTINTPEFP